MEAVLAVSTLAIASAVAWADWVMSCCGVGSEAMSQVLGDQGLIMVRLGKIQGEEYDTKMAVTWEPLVQFASEFDTM